MASAARVMEKPIAHQNQQQQQQQQQILKCPRCDSSNTKFCYYNNYNLSQPRHFCKACKRYWTRGGTLRNVPVGGGCRKNKRIKRPITSTSTSAHAGAVITAPAPVDQNPNLNSNPNPDHLTSSSSVNNSNHHLNPLFYGLLPQNPSFPRFDSRVSNVNNNNNSNVVSGYDFLQPHMTHMNDLGLGFSSQSSGEQIMANHNSNSPFSSYPPMFGGGSTSSSTGAPSMASLLASSLQQQQRFMGFAPYEEGGGSAMKDVKMEGTQGRMDWNINNFHGQNNNNQIEAVGSSNPNSLLWNTTAGGDGGWSDPTENLDSSVSSLI